MSDVFYHDNTNFIFKVPVHFVLKCVAIEVPIWTESNGHIRSVERHINIFLMKNDVSTYFSSGDNNVLW